MTTPATILALLSVLAVSAGVPSAAWAKHSKWVFGAGFHVGGLHVKVGYRDHGHYYAGPYYRVKQRLRYPGYRCGHACLRKGKHYYHHASCPLLRSHFYRYGFDGHRLHSRYRSRVVVTSPGLYSSYHQAWRTRHHYGHPRHH